MGKVVVVTGANRGLGFEIAKDARARGHEVVALSRSLARGEEAKRVLESAGPGPAVRVVDGDLGTVAGVAAAGAKLREACPIVHVLVHNAGLWPSARRVDEHGLEEAFVVNHLAPFALSHALLPRLAPARGRVVLVTAGLYVAGRPSIARTPSGADFDALRTYASTKACALALLPRLAERFTAHGVTINAVHPGVLRTGLGDRTGVLGALVSFAKRFWRPASSGVASVSRLAFDEGLEATTGALFLEHARSELAAPAADRELAAALWEHAVRVTGEGA